MWTYDRWLPFDTNGAPILYLNSGDIIRGSFVYPVLVKDPLGGQEVHWFVVPGSLDSAKEIAVFQFAPSAPAFLPTAPRAGLVRETHKFFKYGDRSGPIGDSHFCVDEDGYVVFHGNPRTWKTIEREWDGSGNTLWGKLTWGRGWDGYGHYGIWYEEPYGAPGSMNRYPITAVEYQLVVADPDQYQTDRVARSASGGTDTSFPPTEMDGPTEDADTALQAYTGEFRAFQNDLFDDNGLPTLRTDLCLDYTDTTASFSFNFDSLTLTPPTPTNCAGIVTTFTYDAGNLASVTKSGGDAGGGPYRALRCAWEGGVLKATWWGNDPNDSFYEFFREIDGAGRIHSQADANSALVTTFDYDTIGRLKTITPPVGESVARMIYPLDDSQTVYTSPWTGTTFSWTTGHRIQFYKGAASAMPALTPSPGTSGVTAEAVASVHAFDDLGRLWKTNSVTPDGNWNETTTYYGADGGVVFRSEPQAKQASPPVQTVSYSLMNGSVTGPGHFEMTVPAMSGPYGTWLSPYTDATQSAPFSSNPYRATLDPFYRTRLTLRPDTGAITTTAYAGLTSYVTTYVGPSAAASTTTYTRDILGNLLAATPPGGGAAAAYTYDGLGNLRQVVLGVSQTRSFRYDSLGHLRKADQPESGIVQYLGYDAFGNLLEFRDGKGQAGGYTLRTAYDDRGRPSSMSKGTQPLASWSYDTGSGYPLNRLTGSIAYQYGYDESYLGTVSETYTYDQPGGRLGKRAVTVDLSALSASLPARTYGLFYTYDNLGLPQREDYQRDPAFGFTLYSTYSRGALAGKAFQNDGKGVQNLAYNPSGALSQVEYKNVSGTSLRAIFTEDSIQARLRSISVTKTSTSSVQWSTGNYAYDPSGNILSVGPSNFSYTDTFSYDLLSRLTDATVNHQRLSGGGNVAVSLHYGFDVFGNLTLRDITNDASLSGAIGRSNASLLESEADLVATPSPSNSNRLASVTKGRNSGGLAPEVTTDLSSAYDGNGNPTFDGGNSLTFDAQNRVTKAVLANSAGVERYFYDAAGERAAVVRYSGTEAQALLANATYYGRSGAQVAGEETFDFAASTDKAKAYLYVGSNLAVTEEGDVGAGGGGGCTVTCAASVPSSGAVGQSLSFAGSGTASGCSGSLTYDWNYGDGTSHGTAASVTHAYTATGTYSWTLTASAGGTACVKNGSVTISTCASPTIQTQPQSQTVPPNGSATLGVSATGVSPLSYQWYRQTGTNWTAITGATGSSYTTPSLSQTTGYKVRVTSGCGSATDSATATVTVGGTAYSLSGTVSGAVTSGVAMALSGAASGTQTTGNGGTYTFNNLSTGSYTVTPSLYGYTFSPASQNVTISNAHVTGVNFTASAGGNSYGIGGYVYLLDGGTAGVAGVTVHCNAATAQTDGSGHFLFGQLSSGTYTLSAEKTGWAICPAQQTVTITNAGIPDVQFMASQGTTGSRTISGTVWACASGVPSVSVRVTDPGGTLVGSATTNLDGDYSVGNLSSFGGPYTVTPYKRGFVFQPISRGVEVCFGDQSGVDFNRLGSCLAGSVRTEGGAPVPGVGVEIEGSGLWGTTDARGHYAIVTTPLGSGTYVVRPTDQSQAGYAFSPASYEVALPPTADQALTDFTAMARAADGENGRGPEPDVGPGGSNEPWGGEPEGEDEPAQTEAAGDMMAESMPSANLAAPGNLTVRFYAWDHLGTVRLVTDETGAVLSTNDYEPFGVQLRNYAPTGNTHQFTGHERDAQTGLDYMHARYYGSNLGRFLSSDKVWGRPESPQSWNLYSYVDNNPVRYNDPTGLFNFGAMTEMTARKYMRNEEREKFNKEQPKAELTMVAAGLAVAMVAAIGMENPVAGAALGKALESMVRTSLGDCEGAEMASKDALLIFLGGVEFKGGGAPRGAPQKGQTIAGRTFEDVIQNPETFRYWLKSSHPADKPLTAAEATTTWQKLLELGKTPVIHEGHPGTKWEGPHIKVEGSHIPVDPTFKPPTP